ncbi:hypothetical protein BSKO_08531 [Bryopsis sp. KO-2023]|nr:hypothetical protein BSKO_08531 [Bryopsis sp. KO-2023]
MLETLKTHEVEERDIEEGGEDLQDFPEHNRQGPRLSVSSETLLFHTAPSRLCESILRVTNSGSTAVFYEWVQERPELPDPATGGVDEDRFFLFNKKGAILPGHHTEFRFGFRSSRPGRFLETWTMNTSPKTVEAIPTISLRGLAVVSDESSLRRKNCVKKLDSREKMRKVKSAIERIIRNVETPPLEPPTVHPTVDRKREIFDGKNIDMSPPVYFEEAAFDNMAKIYSKIYEVLYPPIIEEEKKPAKPAKGKKKNPEPEVVVEERPPETWDGSVDTLTEFIAKLQETAASDAESHRNELRLLLSGMRLPSDERLIVHRAVRRVLLTVAESMEEMAPKVLEECMERYDAARRSSRPEQEDEEATESAEEEAPSYNPEEYSQELTLASKKIITDTLSVENQISVEKSLIADYMDGMIEEARTAYEGCSGQQGRAGELEQLSWAEFDLLRKKGKLKLENDT